MGEQQSLDWHTHVVRARILKRQIDISSYLYIHML